MSLFEQHCTTYLLHGKNALQEITKIKQKRRTLKNRCYAQNCRSKRLCQKNNLEVTNLELKEKLQLLKNDRDNLQVKLANLVQALNIILREQPENWMDKIKALTVTL